MDVLQALKTLAGEILDRQTECLIKETACENVAEYQAGTVQRGRFNAYAECRNEIVEIIRKIETGN